MARQSISITKPNTDWLKSQIDRQEYISMTDAVNDLIRQARRKEEARIEKIRALLIEGEESIKQHGYSTKTMDDIRKEVLVRKGLNG
jgi:antitoxin ParD1/3/4